MLGKINNLVGKQRPLDLYIKKLYLAVLLQHCIGTFDLKRDLKATSRKFIFTKKSKIY